MSNFWWPRRSRSLTVEKYATVNVDHSIGMEQKTNGCINQNGWVFLDTITSLNLGLWFVLLNIRVSSNFAEKNHIPSLFRSTTPMFPGFFLVDQPATSRSADRLPSTTPSSCSSRTCSGDAARQLRHSKLQRTSGTCFWCSNNRLWSKMCSGKSNVAGKKIMTDNILENHIKKKKKHKVNYRWRIFQQAVELNSRVCKFHPPMSILFYNITLGP